MAKRKRNQNIEKKIKQGCGMGRQSEYKPWITIQEVPSMGRASRIKGIKTNRQHDFLSDMERNYFYYLDYSDQVIDIREQYPLLPLEETVLISEELGIKHPTHPDTGEYIVMTTDFLITLNNGTDVARTIKSKDELSNRRVIEKFEIEKAYWDKNDIDWGIVTENEIDKVVAKNIADIHSFSNIGDIDSLKGIDAANILDLTYELTRRIIGAEISLRQICNQFDTDMMLDKGTALSMFRHLLINKVLGINMQEKIDINKMVSIVKVDEDILGKVKVV